ncbi:MAG TPA: efflux transporter outer membrane subunit [bacterium]
MTTSRSGLLLAALAATVALTGCANLAPKYSRPAAPVPEAWPAGAAYQGGGGAPAAGAAAVADIPWREFFLDERLRQVIALSLQNNRDLRVAALAIERSRAQYQIQEAVLYPEVSATATANAQRLPADFSSTGKAMTLHQYTVGLGVAAWEVDFFGRVRSLRDAALEQYLASEHARRAAQIALVSQVAATWLSLAADRERLQVANETLAALESAYQLNKSRFDAGVTSALDLYQSQTIRDTARAEAFRYTTMAAQDENALNLAVGSPVPAELLPQALSDEVSALEEFRPGLGSEVLLSRPDILQAEARLKGAGANIGAARAAFYPSITLIASAGVGSTELGGLFGGGSGAWQFAPRVNLPIFDAGSNRANLKAAEVDRDVAVARYEQAIQTAFREVADALAQRGTIDGQLAAQQSNAAAAAETMRLSQARYDKGVDSYLAVLDSQRAVYQSRQSLISTRLTRLLNQATLYKVLGGGAAE